MPAMKIFIVIMCTGLWYQAVSARQAYAWSQVKTSHFIVYYKNTPLDMVERIAQGAEENYSTITENLGLRRFNFWLWENRAVIYIHDDTADYQLSTNRPAWSGGFTMAQSKTIHTFLDPQGLYEGTLAHEIGHIVFREAVGFENQAVPMWFEEGVASLQEYLEYGGVKALMKTEIEKGNFLPLEKLSTIDPHVLSQRESSQPIYQGVIRFFYLESISIVAYLIEVFGKNSFSVFCRALRNTGKFDEALAKAYPFKNSQELSRGWEAYLRAQK